MPITPLDVQNKEFKTAIFGYNKEEVDDFLDQLNKQYEKLYRENLEAQEQLSIYRHDLEHYKELEETLKSTLLVAQQTAEEIKRNAEKESELIIQEAHIKAKAIEEESLNRAKQIQNEYAAVQRQALLFKNNLKNYLTNELEILEASLNFESNLNVAATVEETE